jgi:hypothetical protein
MKTNTIQTKLRQLLLLSALSATVVNFPAHAQDYGPLIVDGTAHPAESGTTYTATPDNSPLTVIGISETDGGNEGSYTGTNTFTVANNQLTFTATAIPEPSVWFLLGAGITLFLITAHHRRRNQS